VRRPWQPKRRASWRRWHAAALGEDELGWRERLRAVRRVAVKMPLSAEDIYEKALAMSVNVEDNFLDLGRQLRQLQDRDPELPVTAQVMMIFGC